MNDFIRMDKSSIFVAVLAAGLSSRFVGGNKLDAICLDRPLGTWATTAVEQTGIEQRAIVVGAEAPKFIKDLVGWQIITNDAVNSGLASSVAKAAEAASGHRLVIALADMPLVGTAHLLELALSRDIVFSRYPDGQLGVPAGFPPRCLDRLAKLGSKASDHDWGEPVVSFTPETESQLFDVDTMEDLIRVAAHCKSP